MNREAQVRFCEGLGVRVPRATRLVVLSRYSGARLKEWIRSQLEDWLGLELNRDKTSVVNLRDPESLDFLGYTFRYDWDLKGRNWKYLNVEPSKKSQKKSPRGHPSQDRTSQLFQAHSRHRGGTQRVSTRLEPVLPVWLSKEGNATPPSLHG